ncbi:MAG: hypothetical protein AAGM67_08365 [Bacteroidota bacterium]
MHHRILGNNIFGIKIETTTEDGEVFTIRYHEPSENVYDEKSDFHMGYFQRYGGMWFLHRDPHVQPLQTTHSLFKKCSKKDISVYQKLFHHFAKKTRFEPEQSKVAKLKIVIEKYIQRLLWFRKCPLILLHHPVWSSRRFFKETMVQKYLGEWTLISEKVHLAKSPYEEWIHQTTEIATRKQRKEMVSKIWQVQWCHGFGFDFTVASARQIAHDYGSEMLKPLAEASSLYWDDVLHQYICDMIDMEKET